MQLELKSGVLHVVGRGAIEPTTPTVSRGRAGTPTPLSLVESDGSEGSDMGKKGTDGGLVTHSGSIATLG
jgi:hypothetical protein